MIPIEFIGVNKILAKPKDWDDDQCSNLPVFAVEDSNLKTSIHTSCWALTNRELEEVKKTGVIWLTVVGATHPPILVQGISPFETKGRIIS